MELQNIKVADTRQSATNIKGRNEGKTFDELVASIKEKGVLVPILVRKIHKAGYEVIAGHRRLFATKTVGNNSIPAQIVKMTDSEAREAQIVENLQREDIHPLDEGELYRKLIEESKYDTASIAAKVGKNESYVNQRLFITNLEKEPAEKYRKGKIMDGHAVLIAKLSAGDQIKALKEIINSFDLPTVKELKNWIEEHIYSPLEYQPWNKNQLVIKIVGECVECEPNRASLFGKVKEGACTDMKCWARKMEKYIAWRIKDGKLARVSSEYGQAPKGIYSMSDYVQVAKKGKDRCKSVHGAIVVSGADIGKELEICTNPNCLPHRGMKSQYEMTPKEQENRRVERKKEAIKTKKDKDKREDKLEKALAKVKWPMSTKHLDVLLEILLDQPGFNLIRSVTKRHKLEVKKEKTEWGTTLNYEGAVKGMAKELDKKGKLRLIFELIIDTGYQDFKKGINKL